MILGVLVKIKVIKNWNAGTKVLVNEKDYPKTRN